MIDIAMAFAGDIFTFICKCFIGLILFEAYITNLTIRMKTINNNSNQNNNPFSQN